LLPSRSSMVPSAIDWWSWLSLRVHGGFRHWASDGDLLRIHLTY
jgi:hypothetical protein